MKKYTMLSTFTALERYMFVDKLVRAYRYGAMPKAYYQICFTKPVGEKY
jgi:hypothetical protein